MARPGTYRTVLLGVGAIFLTMIGISYFLSIVKSFHQNSGNNEQSLMQTIRRLDRVEENIHFHSIQLKKLNASDAGRYQRTPWDAAKYLLNKCESAGLSLFIIQPSLLRAVQEGKVDVWFQQPQPVVTVGIMESSVDILRKVKHAMESIGYKYWEKLDEDPRGFKPFKPGGKSTKSIVTHVLLWKQVEEQTNMVIHLVVFFDRKDYFWHAAGHDKFYPPPFDLSDSLFGKAAGSYNKFELHTVHVDDAKVRYPSDSLTFLKDIENATFIECNQTRASRFHIHYIDYNIMNTERVDAYRTKTRQLLSLTKSILDKMGIPFWLSGGTCLGWYRQCDIIPYTNDVDIGVLVKDHKEGLVSAFVKLGFVHLYTFGKLSDSYQLSFLYEKLKLDIFFFYVEEKKSLMWMGHTRSHDRAKFKYTFPSFTTIRTEFLGLWLRAPFPPETYVKTDYGPEWMIPSKRWDWTKRLTDSFV